MNRSGLGRSGSLCAFLAFAYSAYSAYYSTLRVPLSRYEGEFAPPWKASPGGPSAKSDADVGAVATLCGRGEVADFAGDGGRYACRPDWPSSAAARRDRHYEYLARHDRLPARTVRLLDRPIGSVVRICEVGAGADPDRGRGDEEDPAASQSRCLLPASNMAANEDVNSPMPVRVRSWMDHPMLRGQSVVLYYSSHASRGSRGIRLLTLDASSRRWKRSDAGVSVGRHPCRTLHSPSVFVSDERERFYM